MVDEFNELEVLRVRLRLLDLIKSFYQSEPDAEKMSRWRGTFSALVKEQVNPLFDNAVRELVQQLNSRSLTEIKDEYYRLFIDPFSTTPVNTMASYYRDGRSFGQTLVSLRELLAEAKLEREKGVVDSEDSIAMMLDVFARLVEREKNGEIEQSRQLQERLLTKFLEPFAQDLKLAVNEVEDAEFYGSCCKLLCGYLDMERSLVAVSWA